MVIQVHYDLFIIITLLLNIKRFLRLITSLLLRRLKSVLYPPTKDSVAFDSALWLRDVADEWTMEVFGNDSIHRILNVTAGIACHLSL